MAIENILLLVLTIFLSGCRNAFSKKISTLQFGRKNFFFSQFLIFLCGSIVLIFFTKNLFSCHLETYLYALIYGALLISAQWCYTMAFSIGKPSICVTVYSLGFILPTISGIIFWSEAISVIGVIGLIVAVIAVIISGLRGNHGNSNNQKGYIIPLIIAMLSSGGLGLMQKIQQKSYVASERSEFVFYAFIFATIINVVAIVLAKKSEQDLKISSKLSAMAIGICFASCNLLNTILAGALPSIFFFPVQNISVILFSLLINATIFKERLKTKEIIVIVLGIVSILLLNLKF